jgi:hypothetical protein
MKENYKRVFWEFALTFLLLLFVTALLGETLSGYRRYLVFGLPAGFIFSWLARGKKSVINLIIISALLAAFFWMAHSLFNSTLIYKRVVTILVEGALILEIILSFDACMTPLLTYIQAISIPLFMACSIFIKDYDQFTVILILGYFAVWAAILKIKFHGLFQPMDKKSKSGYYSASLFIIFFMAILFISWVLFSHFSFGKIKKGGIFLEAGDAEEDADYLEEEYYGLQDKIQDKINRLIPEFKSHDQQYEMLALISSLVKESPDTMEVDKAAQGLIDPWRRPGPGLEEKDSGELTILINDYLNKKTSINMRRAQEDIIDTLKKNRLNIKDRITSSSHLNMMRQGNSFQQINKEGQGLSKIFDDAPFDSKTKRKLKDSLNQFKEWKAFEIYQEKINAINEMINSPANSLKGEFQKMLSGIRAVGSLEDIRKAAQYIEEMQGMAHPDGAEAIKNIKEILKIKSDMLVSLKAKELKAKIEKSGLSEYGLDRLTDSLDAVKDAEGSKMFLERAVELEEKARESGLDIVKEINNFLETKMHILTKAKKDKIEDTLKENIPDDLKKKFLEEVEKILQEESSDKIVSDTRKIENDIERFFNQGLISGASKNNLIKELDGFGDFLLFELKIYKQAGEGEIIKENKQFTYQEELEEFIDNSSIGSEKKQVFKELAKRLSGAKTLLESENIKDEIEAEIGFLPKEGIKQEAIGEFKERIRELTEISRKFIIDAASSNLREAIEELKKANLQEAKTLEWHLREIRNSQNSEGLERNIEKLKEYSRNQKLRKSEESSVAGDNLLRLYILPPRLIMPVGSSVNLKVFAVYNSMFFKEINSDLKWSSSQPLTAYVDSAGAIHPKSQGRAVIEARYKGIITSAADVMVVSGIADEIGMAIKKETAR